MRRVDVGLPRRRRDLIIKADIDVAKRNWLEWQDVYEHVGLPEDNILLKDNQKFRNFVEEYSISRTIRRGTRDAFQQRLCNIEFNFSSVLNDPTGVLLDNYENILRHDFGTCNGQRGLTSALSKLAAFLAPQYFVAWDTYARKGVNRVYGRPPTRLFENYSRYLSDINELLSGELGQHVCDSCKAFGYPTQKSARDHRFHRRVLDVYLMRKGGRGQFYEDYT